MMRRGRACSHKGRNTQAEGTASAMILWKEIVCLYEAKQKDELMQLEYRE